uniref:NADH dehydrogenase subunit 2 n=1 Tax=Wellcomia siamensis TaxID=435744 RepID=G4V254_WELSI|nr:NADH dehydrogenase subunit 2 [Wellcomia siamensis]ACV96771.1 NADH dehydrogenase subunit 2 [Wellcomia siamensis]
MLYFFFFFLVLQVINVLLWWSVFVFMDLVFIFICKENSSFCSILNYYIFQECLGLLFLIFIFNFLQCLILMSKMGLLPLHFWLFVVVGGLKSWLLMWFLTWQKLPFMGVLMMILVNELFFLFIFSFFLVYFQLFVVKNFKFMIVLSSTESFNWILLGYLFSFFNGFFLFLYYFFLSIFLVPFFSSEVVLEYDWLVIYMYMSMPLGMSFFIKFFMVSYLFFFNCIWFIVVMIFLFISFLALFFWMVLKGAKESFFFNKLSIGFYLIVGSLFLVLF